MMADLSSIVLNLLSSCLSACITLFDRLGAVPYLVSAGIFLAFMRFLVLPLLDHGSSINGLGLNDSIHNIKFRSSFLEQKALPSGSEDS